MKALKESSETGNVNEQENEEVCNLSTYSRARFEDPPATNFNQPIATSCEDTQAIVLQTSKSIDPCIQDAEKIFNVKCISGSLETTVNAIRSANTAITQLDTIGSTYLQPLSIFNAVVTDIVDVRLSNT